MRKDVKQLSQVELTPEQLEWHIRHAHQLRSEALASGVRRFFTGLRRKHGAVTRASERHLVPGARKRQAH